MGLLPERFHIPDFSIRWTSLDGCGHTNGTLSNGTYNEQFKGEYMFQLI